MLDLIDRISDLYDRLSTLVPWWAALIIVAVLVLIVGFVFRHPIARYLRNSDKLEHDKKVFQRLDNVLDEGKLKSILDQLLESFSITQQSLSKLHDYLDATHRTENRYLGWRIRRHHGKYGKAILSLENFLGGAFIPTSSQIALFSLIYSGGKPVGTPEKELYDQRKKKLLYHCQAVVKAHTNYRLAIKKKLSL